MSGFILEPLAWFALLSRPAVLLQLLPIAVLVLAYLPLRRRSLRLRRLPWGIPLLPALALLGWGLALAGQRWGLVWLVAELLLAWLGLRLLETQILGRLLPPELYGVLVSRILRPLFLLGVGLVALDALDSLQTVADLPLGVWLGSSIQLGQLAWVSALLYLVVMGSALPAAWLSWLAQRGLQLGDGGRRALELVIRYVLVSLGVLWAFNALGINQTGLLAVAGGLSVGLGFGIKEVFSNFISGLWLLFEGSVRPGEVLMHEGEACEVRRLGLRAATLWRGSDNAELVVPNQTFFTHTTTTYTRSDRTRRCRLEIQAAASWPPVQIIALLVEIAAAEPDVLLQPPATARLVEFGPEMNRYGLSYTIADPLRASRITAGLLLEIWKRFEARGILTAPAGEDAPVDAPVPPEGSS
ncbi:MAG: mechanosensitive ion channel [Cyanobium sp. M30B3]|nr:MAG: mechanosensitive ion channel [Cyanobium sp. M30B3]